MAKLRRDLEDATINFETQLGGMRKKHNDAVAEMGDQLDQVQKQKSKYGIQIKNSLKDYQPK